MSVQAQTSKHRVNLTWTEGWVLGLALAAVLASVMYATGHATRVGFFANIFITLVCVVAGVVDAATRRIPNALTYPAIGIALGLSAAVTVLQSADAFVVVTWLGAPAFGQALLGCSVCGALGLVGFTTAGLGGGDVKLLAAAGASLGVGAAVGIIGSAIVFAALFALVNLAVGGRLVTTLQEWGVRIIAAIAGGSIEPATNCPTRDIPLAPAILAGLLLSPLLGTHDMLWELVTWS